GLARLDADVADRLVADAAVELLRPVVGVGDDEQQRGILGQGGAGGGRHDVAPVAVAAVLDLAHDVLDLRHAVARPQLGPGDDVAAGAHRDAALAGARGAAAPG